MKILSTLSCHFRGYSCCLCVKCYWIYLLTAIGLTPGGKGTVHIYTQTKTINLGRVRAVPRLCELYPGICLTTEEKARKNLSQGSRRVPVGTMKGEYTEQNIHKHKNI